MREEEGGEGGGGGWGGGGGRGGGGREACRAGRCERYVGRKMRGQRE